MNMRPTGVTVIAIMWGISAVFYLLIGLAMLIAPIALPISELGAMGAMIAMFGSVIGVVMLIFGIVFLVIAYGLWTLKNWARIITIILCGISVVFTVLGFVAMATMSPMLAMPGMESVVVTTVIQGVVAIIINCLIIWYLIKVKEAFS